MPFKMIGKMRYYTYLDKYEEAEYWAKQKEKPDPGISARAMRTVREGGSASISVAPKKPSAKPAD